MALHVLLERAGSRVKPGDKRREVVNQVGASEVGVTGLARPYAASLADIKEGHVRTGSRRPWPHGDGRAALPGAAAAGG